MCTQMAPGRKKGGVDWERELRLLSAKSMLIGGEIWSSIGPVDKSKNSAEIHRFSGRTLELEIEIDGIYHSLKV